MQTGTCNEGIFSISTLNMLIIADIVFSMIVLSQVCVCRLRLYLHHMTVLAFIHIRNAKVQDSIVWSSSTYFSITRTFSLITIFFILTDSPNYMIDL